MLCPSHLRMCTQALLCVSTLLSPRTCRNELLPLAYSLWFSRLWSNLVHHIVNTEGAAGLTGLIITVRFPLLCTVRYHWLGARPKLTKISNFVLVQGTSVQYSQVFKRLIRIKHRKTDILSIVEKNHPVGFLVFLERKQFKSIDSF